MKNCKNIGYIYYKMYKHLQSEMNDMGEEKIPKLDLVKDFDPDNPRVQTDPLVAALSIGMQQMPGGIAGMQNVMMQFMKATETGNWYSDDINTRDIENMMFDPDDRTLARISSLMETRYEEVAEIERQLLAQQKAQEEKEKEETEKEETEQEEKETEEK